MPQQEIRTMSVYARLEKDGKTMKLLVDNNGFSDEQLDGIFLHCMQQFAKENALKISGQITKVENKIITLP